MMGLYRKRPVVVEARQFTGTAAECHVSMRVRGVLCDSCNKGLGFFRDDPARLRAAIRYLKRG